MTRSLRLLAVLLAAALGCAGSRPAPAPAAPAAAPQPQAAAAPAGADRTQVPAAGEAPELHLPRQQHFALANGLRVRLVEHRRLPIVALNLVVRAGAVNDPAGLPGLASFTASMLTEGGTRSRTATRLSDEVGFLGASLGAGTGQDAASLSGSSLSRHLPKLLDLFADVAMNPAFRAKDFARVQDQRKVTLLQQRDQPATIAGKAFLKAYWGEGHPYGHYVLGDEASVAATRPADLAAFHARFWRPANAELVVVGDVSEAELRPLLERTLGKWPAGTAAAAPRAPAPAAPHVTLLLDKPDAPQTLVMLGMPGLARASPDYVAATVAFQVLGGGMSSRLFRTLREEKGYTYGMGAGADARRLGGVSIVHGNVKAEVTGAALGDLLGEIRKLRDQPVGDAELADARNALVRSLPADFATVGGIAGRVAELVIHGLPDDYWNGYADAVRDVAPADVQRIAERYLDPARATLVLVGTPAAVRPQLEGLAIGKVEVRPVPGAAPVRAPPRSPRVRTQRPPTSSPAP
ncbi:peptidase M16 domain protein [Anaeromyxobacter dehalogenans 2CP-1]|uniref:Peptidase M16 domain protein n=1 Tax=Anaeromyxobacter dehalogenans (strain ATCC BAA-258 / DSM 21875 / 2CP-1) TaxID=455488 RepID=B8J7Y8_ANAD2|nr:pitrilysin family protein [Anaeromyxobacter dehalogenans]ACL63480.1 peptidase M16 domain protein [Anaeromyxobacter dehalogenans 2CP-1]